MAQGASHYLEWGGGGIYNVDDMAESGIVADFFSFTI